MVTLITVVHVIVAVFLILVVLLQSGKGASMGAAFGGASQTVFGASGAGSFLTKLTTGSAIFFMFTSLALAYLSTHSGSSLEKAAREKSKMTEQKSQTIAPEGQSIPPPAPDTAKAAPEKPEVPGAARQLEPKPATPEPAGGGNAAKPPPDTK